MYRVYTVSPIGRKTLFNTDGLLDQTIALNPEAVYQFDDESNAASAGHFRPNYLDNWFTERGLVHRFYGPPLKSFAY